MAFPAGLGDICMKNLAPGIARRQNTVYAMAISAYCYFFISLIEQGFAVNRGLVKPELIGRELGIKPFHIFDVGMTFPTERRYSGSARRILIPFRRIHSELGITFLEPDFGIASMTVLASETHIAMDIAVNENRRDSSICNPIGGQMTADTARIFCL